jgi:hypothetical protein
MELRLLSSPEDRREFAHNLVETRLSKGAGFCETGRSLVGEVHLAFGQLYALFDETSPSPREMLSGFVLHDLACFPQSYPKPDLTHLPPESVLECGELWAKVAGSARMTRQAAWILAGELEAQAVLLYPIFSPWNLSGPYHHDFDRAGEPIEWPYIRSTEGGKIFVQAMVSQGQKLARLVGLAGQDGFSASADHSRIRFTTPFNIYRKAGRVKRPSGVPAEAPGVHPASSVA